MDRASLQTLSRTFGVAFERPNGEINVKCPACKKRGMGEDGSGKSAPGHLGLNFERNVGYCVRCAFGVGNLSKWLRGVMTEKGFGGEVENLLTSLHAGASLTLADDAFKVEAETPPDFAHQVLDLRSSFTFFDEDRPPRLFTRSMRSKGVSMDEAIRARLAFCNDENDFRWFGRVIFPYLEDGDIVFWQGRSCFEEAKLPKRNADAKDGAFLGKSCWLYGVDSAPANGGGTAVLVEGCLDQITTETAIELAGLKGLWCCGLSGSSISAPGKGHHWLNSQAGKLSALEPERVVVMMDPDASKKGGNACRICEHLRSRGIPSHVAHLPEHDPNRTGPEPLADFLTTLVDTLHKGGDPELSDLDF